MKIDRHRAIPYILVTIQFICALAIVVAGTDRMPNPVSIAFILVGTIVGLAAIVSMRLGNFRIVPVPKDNAILVTRGIYRYIRHPMYSGLLLLAFGFVTNAAGMLSYILWIILLINLVVKLRFEEKLLIVRFPEYRSYRSRTQRLVPFLW